MFNKKNWLLFGNWLGIAHEIKNPLNFVNNFASLSGDLIKEYNSTDDIASKADILKDLQLNIEKINVHGKRADSIVTKMLGEQPASETNRLQILTSYAEEDLNLAYKGAEFGNPGFNCEIECSFDEHIPSIKAVTQEISRVLLNIINNGFYAMMEKQKESADFHPKITVRTNFSDKRISISIRDNGGGIPESISKNIFSAILHY